jgi:hypothetical protein
MEAEIKKSSEKKNDNARPKWGGVKLKNHQVAQKLETAALT